jgi:hypothetical protein
VFSRQDSSTAPQSTQTATSVWGIKYFSSVRLYSAPQLHRTIVFMAQICARAGFYSSVARQRRDPRLRDAVSPTMPNEIHQPSTIETGTDRRADRDTAAADDQTEEVALGSGEAHHCPIGFGPRSRFKMDRVVTMLACSDFSQRLRPGLPTLTYCLRTHPAHVFSQSSCSAPLPR